MSGWAGGRAWLVRCVAARRHLIGGVCLALAGAFCWAGTVVCLRRSLRAHLFYAPFFVTYVSTSLSLAIYPVYVVFRVVIARAKLSLREITRYGFTSSLSRLVFSHTVCSKLTNLSENFRKQPRECCFYV